MPGLCGKAFNVENDRTNKFLGDENHEKDNFN
jgi:hypothetical protein